MLEPAFDLERFKQQLADAIAWCLARGSTNDVEHSLRTSVPSKPDVLYSLPNKVSEDEAVGQLRRQRGYEAFFAARTKKLHSEQILVRPSENNLAGGRLLIFDVYRCLYEGAMYLDSDGFFDGEEDDPPWDTWVYYDPVEELRICWIPPLFIPYAEAGMVVMTGEWNRWVTGEEDYEFVKILKREGFFKSL